MYTQIHTHIVIECIHTILVIFKMWIKIKGPRMYRLLFPFYK